MILHDSLLQIFLQYRNECEMLKASCEMKSPLSFLHHGACTDAELQTKLQGEFLSSFIALILKIDM